MDGHGPYDKINGDKDYLLWVVMGHMTKYMVIRITCYGWSTITRCPPTSHIMSFVYYCQHWRVQTLGAGFMIFRKWFRTEIIKDSCHLYMVLQGWKIGIGRLLQIRATQHIHKKENIYICTYVLYSTFINHIVYKLILKAN